MLLVFNRSCAYGNIGKQIVKIAVIFGIEHLVRTGETGFVQRAHMKLANCDNAPQQVAFSAWVGLVEHTLVAVTRCSRLVGVDTRNNKNLVLDLLLQRSKAGNIVHHAVFIVCGTGADDKNKAFVPALKDCF